MCVLAVFLSDAPAKALLTPLSKTASWGPEQSVLGRFGDPPAVEAERIRIGEAWSYESASGRTTWLSRDPLEEAEFIEGPNLYCYVQNDPVNLVDPTGEG